MTMLATGKSGNSLLFMSAPLVNLVVGTPSAAMWGARHLMAAARGGAVRQYELHGQSLFWPCS